VPDNLNTEFPDYIVKFPDVTVPKGYRVDSYVGYVPVKGFTKAGHHSRGETVRSDGMLPVQWPDPVVISLTPKLMARVNAICGKGLLKGEKIHCIHLARNDSDEHTESFEMELVGVSLEKQGDSVVVLYQKYTDKSHNGDDPPDEGGYDFLKQKKLD
jgi:hypothetical protein